ncbi:ulp1 protease family, C-terminal catalytic domain-containing protein [Tanacetum coccineum]
MGALHTSFVVQCYEDEYEDKQRSMEGKVWPWIRLDQVVITLASGDKCQGFDPHSLQGRRSFSTFGRNESSLSTLGMQDFLIFAQNNRVNSGGAGIYCPCIDCKNFVRLKNIKDIEYHLITRGFVQKYTCWSKHGELLVDNSTSVRTSIDNENGVSYINDDCGNSNEMYDNVEDVIGDNDQENLLTQLEDSQKPSF